MGIMWWSDIERLSIIMTLHDIGFTNENIEKYMRLLADGSGTQKQRMDMLNKKRNGILSEVHFKEKQISRLDYLRYEIQKENQKMGDWYAKNVGKSLALYLTPLMMLETMVNNAPHYVLLGI